jgi:DNA-binding LytR/AlgR family response regulator
MGRKLQCILVDDDPLIHDIFKKYLENNEYVEITDYYLDPREFANSNKKPDFVFLDVVMPYINGFSLAISIKPTPVILFTGRAEYFRDIMNKMEAIDAFPKPIAKERLLKSVEGAYHLLHSTKLKKTHQLFSTNEGQVNILLSDIFFVRTIKNTHRYLDVYLKDGRKLIFKGYSLEYIHKVAGFLLQSNRAELVSAEAVNVIEHNSLIKLHGISDNGKPITSSLCLSFRKTFLEELNT